MAFFTPCYKKIKQFLVLHLLLGLFAAQALAGASSVNIKSASLTPAEEAYSLNADLDIKLSEKMVELVSKGFALNFLIEFQLSSPRKYWFDDEIATATQHVTLTYHALSRQFLLIRGDQQKTFVRLDEAMDDLSYLSDFKVFQKSEIEKGESYKAALLVRLDPKKLPKVLQGEVVGSDDWSMSSQRFEWVPSLFK